MNIEELFNNEKWAGYGLVVTDDANLAIDYLKTEVMEYVAGLQKQIAELEAQRDEGRKWVKEAHELAAIRITELEADKQDLVGVIKAMLHRGGNGPQVTAALVELIAKHGGDA